MQDQLSGEGRPQKQADPFDEMWLYLGAMADTSGGESVIAAFESLTGKESVKEILKTAIELEKETILFYIGLKDIFSAEGVKEKVNRIIDEEKGNSALLKQKFDEIEEYCFVCNRICYYDDSVMPSLSS